MHLTEKQTLACGQKTVYNMNYDADNEVSRILLSATLS